MVPRITVVDCGSRKVAEIIAALARAGSRPRRWPLSVCDALPPAEALVISGGAHLFTSEPELAERFAFVDHVATPILGICLGHQALALRAGARCFLGPERRGVETVDIVAPHPLFAGLEAPVDFRADHCEGISLPPSYRLLARSKAYAVEAMGDDARRRYGVQFHPEISGAAGARLLANFVAFVSAICPSAAASSADRA